MPTVQRILYSFPTRLGGPGIGTTAWHQVAGLAERGRDVTVICGSLERPLPAGVAVHETMRLPRGPKVPYRVVGKDRALTWHDRRATKLLNDAGSEAFDVVHTWPLGAARTLEAARAIGTPSALERPNAHTAFAFAAVAEVVAQLGIGHDASSPHAYDAARLAREEREYALADGLLCPSEFVAGTFAERGFAPEVLLRHRYGYDPERFSAAGRDDAGGRPFTVLFAGRGEPRKGLHVALEAWHGAGAGSAGGRFVIAGPIDAPYLEVLAPLLDDPSVEHLGPTGAMADVMRAADVLVLPSVEEGSALVTYEARATGCVLAVSDHAGAVAEHEVDALIHPAGSVTTLTEHLRALQSDPALLARLRTASLAGAEALTWAGAAEALEGCYGALSDAQLACTA
ncbi:MAG: glycosyltransferase family 4 protein [Baekduia sp.]